MYTFRVDFSPGILLPIIRIPIRYHLSGHDLSRLKTRRRLPGQFDRIYRKETRAHNVSDSCFFHEGS